MRNSFRKAIFNHLDSRGDRGNVYHSLEPIHLIKNSTGAISHILLKDHHGLLVEIPTTIFKANGADYLNPKEVIVSDGMYKTWFGEKKKQVLEELQQLIQDNFNEVVKHSSIILNDNKFYAIELPMLQSNLLYSHKEVYTIGSLLESWLNSDELIYHGLFIIRVSGSLQSGNNFFTGFCPETKAIVKGSIHSNWFNYFKVFRKMSMKVSPRNESEILTLERFALKLNLN